MSEFKQSEMIQTALEGVKDVICANTVLGSPITVENGTTIIPVSKVSVGLATGGVDYYCKNAPQTANAPAFGGAGGTGITVTPIGFLIVKTGGTVELLTVDAAANKPTSVSIIESVVEVLERSPDLAEKLKETVMKFVPEKKNDQTGATEVAVAEE